MQILRKYFSLSEHLLVNNLLFAHLQTTMQYA